MIEGLVVIDDDSWKDPVLGTFVVCPYPSEQLQVQWQGGLRVEAVLQHAFENNIPIKLMPVIPRTE